MIDSVITDSLKNAASADRVVLVHIDLYRTRMTQEDLGEFHELVMSSGAEIVGQVLGKRAAPDAKYFVGRGKLEEIQASVLAGEANLVLFNHDLSPAQERNLERSLHCRVFDRTALILDIFAQRARTFEGKLQVELAQLEHLSTRLVRGWGHLERQRGGIGLRGPGETQLEVDRRLIRNRIKSIHKRLGKVRSQRQQGRRSRRRARLLTISLVGYTNAGKSTLFNRLTASDVYVADKLFATLDPTLRRIKLPQTGIAILADTVGFISHLPHDLVSAFRATLEETQEADLLLHVVDVSDAQHEQKMACVSDVLAEINAQKIPQLVVYNKVDLLSDHQPRIDHDPVGQPWRVWLSAETGAGIDLLLNALRSLLSEDLEELHFCIPPAEGRLRGACYKRGEVVFDQPLDNGGWEMRVRFRRGVMPK